mmetsp:Transcript_15231/g.17662  ORF Transcript_15231/g.17662 Transcript_15231/m.17662 type:complete len:158 (-) Transcript_15231:126-599(-)
MQTPHLSLPTRTLAEHEETVLPVAKSPSRCRRAKSSKVLKAPSAITPSFLESNGSKAYFSQGKNSAGKELDAEILRKSTMIKDLLVLIQQTTIENVSLRQEMLSIVESKMENLNESSQTDLEERSNSDNSIDFGHLQDLEICVLSKATSSEVTIMDI